MGKKIIVAGGGHGGIATAYILSKVGYDVTVYEKNTRENMGYDWTDIFDKKGFIACGMELPPEEMYTLKQNMTFYGPSYSKALVQDTPADQLEIKMERKDIYKYLISNAEAVGVKFQFETEILSPIMLGSRVAGIKTDKGDYLADLVIDAAGMDSPVRKNLPKSLGIQNELREYERFYVYRAFFNKAAETLNEDEKFKVLMLNENILGICWVAAEEEYTDVLIGRFESFDKDEVDRTVAALRETNPSIGEAVVRGGQFVNIPVRHPLAVMVADGYAAIGDSAFMTVPIIGSGIANSLKASAMLANTVIKDKDELYSAQSLWEYQTTYYDELGKGLAPLACVKLMLTRLEGADLDYIFENGILNADDMTIGADSTDLGSMLGGMSIDDIKIKISGLVKNKKVLSKVLRLGKEIVKATVVCAQMPKAYNRESVIKWAEKYNDCFNH